jgi:two-component system, sensor histidine kinase RpfC
MQQWLTRKGWVTMLALAQRAELEQAIIRALIPAVVLVCFGGYLLLGGELSERQVHALWFTIGFFLFAIGLALRILAAHNVSVVRRYVGIVADNAGNTYFMLVAGEQGALVFFVYLFITFGNRLRYGRTYMRVCWGLSLLGFLVVLVLSDFWSQHWWVGGGILLAMVVLPFYVDVLANRTDEAKRQAEHANKAKGRFLANVSHEMRTPLNGVIAMADILRETGLNESQREITETLSNSAQLLLVQIEDVLDMAKIEAGRVQLETSPFDLARLLTSTVKVILPQARYKGLAFHTEIAPLASRWFVGDQHHIRQVVLNLLANAVKFTERGEVVLRARIIDTSNGVSRVRVEIQDTGIGIAPEKQVAIFEPFTQADDSVTRVYGGTGLGTTIARQLVGLMGGELGLESTLGTGSTFWFELPLPQSEPRGIDLVAELASTVKASNVAHAMAAGVGASVHKIRGARVLVAEDNPTNQRVAQLILESGGHVVTIVNNGEAALDALERGGFDLALFDLSMPLVSGLEALKLYRFASSKPIPILILSANVTAESIDECQRAGAAEFIPKPLRASYVLDAIERHLAGESAVNIVAPAPRSDDRPPLTVVDTPLLDVSALKDLAVLSSDPTFIDRLIQGFKTDCQRLVQQVTDGLAHRKYESVKDAAHALKGGAGSVGATQLTQFAVRLEKATHETMRLKSAQLTEELLRLSERTILALQEHLEAQRRQRLSSS